MNDVDIRRILVVGDDRERAELVVRELGLSRLNCEVVEAVGLAGALDSICLRHPDLFVLDMDLGEPAALTTLRAVRLATDAVLVALSRHDDECLGVRALRAGADEYLSNGRINHDDLRAAAVYGLARRERRRVLRSLRERLDALSRLAEG